MQIAFAVALIFAIAVALFAVQNTTPVAVSFLWFQIPQLAVSVLILVCTFMGALLTILVGVGRELRRTLALRSLRGQVAARDRRIKELEEQIEKSDFQPAHPQLEAPTRPLDAEM
jgi:lipopolysaccharide assembly protein A